MNKGLQMLLETLAPIAIKHFGITRAQVQELFNKAYPTVMQAAETVAKFEIALTEIQRQQSLMLATLQANKEELQQQLKVIYDRPGIEQHNGNGVYVNGSGSAD